MQIKSGRKKLKIKSNSKLREINKAGANCGSKSHSFYLFHYIKNVRFNSPETNYEKGIAINAIMCENHSCANRWFKHSQIVQ